MKERRNNLERNRLPVKLQAEVTDIDHTLSVTVMNLSKGGLFIRCSPPPECWNNVSLSIKLPATNNDPSEIIQATGVVVWILSDEAANPSKGLYPGAGIQFLEISNGNLKKLENYMRQHTAQPSKNLD